MTLNKDGIVKVMSTPKATRVCKMCGAVMKDVHTSARYCKTCRPIRDRIIGRESRQRVRERQFKLQRVETEREPSPYDGLSANMLEIARITRLAEQQGMGRRYGAAVDRLEREG